MTIIKKFKELIFKNYLEKRLYMLGVLILLNQGLTIKILKVCLIQV